MSTERTAVQKLKGMANYEHACQSTESSDAQCVCVRALVTAATRAEYLSLQRWHATIPGFNAPNTGRYTSARKQVI